jgi:hypothetical protein
MQWLLHPFLQHIVSLLSFFRVLLPLFFFGSVLLERLRPDRLVAFSSKLDPFVWFKLENV